jgi:hypothetical protein
MLALKYMKYPVDLLSSRFKGRVHNLNCFRRNNLLDINNFHVECQIDLFSFQVAF